ncbi:starch-binding protein associating with outer membrane [Bacteroidales bacterium 6E]|nr:starch-binding protein associating with outer membrane [Bacteroidales bacterium 6E]
MKNIKYLMFISIALFIGVACDDVILDLDKQPLGVPSSAILFETEEGIHMALNGAYSYTRSSGFNAFGQFVAREVGSDDANPGSAPADGSVARMEQVSNFTYLPTQVDLTTYYVHNYTLIARSNLVINNAPNVQMNTVLKARYIGEAKFLRAFSYFNLVKGWGGVSIITDIPKDPQEASIIKPRASEAEVYELIISDLEYAIENLPEKSEYPAADRGRATKGAARTMLAQVYIHQLDFTNALKYAMDVINSNQYSLNPEYARNFAPEHKNGIESIWEIQFIARDERDVSNQWSHWQGIRGYIGWGFNSPSKELADHYEEHDPRREATIFFSGQNWPGSNEIPVFASGTDPRANRKSMLPKPWPVGYPPNSPVNKVEMRYADVILMASEAYNELGNQGNALNYLEMIRSRARAGNPDILPPITTTDQIELRHAIWNERRSELGMEGYRYFDILRYNRLEPGFAQTLFHSLGKTSFDPAKHTRFPIPQSEIDFSGGSLEQNPGW